MKINFIEIYEQIRAEERWISPAIHFQSVCRIIAREGTLEDMQELLKHIEEEAKAYVKIS